MVECAQVIRKANFKMSKQLIYSGKAKDIYTTEDENLIISTYKDQATAFNGVKKEQIAGKGVLNNQISSFIFEKLNAVGVATHFVEKLSDTEQLNKKVKIILWKSCSATTRLVPFQNVLVWMRESPWRLRLSNFTIKMMIWMIHLSMTSM